jgi:hypothetical protein
LVKAALFAKYASAILRLTTQLSVDDFWSAVTPAKSLIFVLPQKLARLSVDQMQPSAGFADDYLVLVVGRILVADDPVLDLQVCCWASEKQRGHQ